MGTIRMNAAQYARYHQRLAERFIPTVKRGILSGAMACIPKLQESTKYAPPANPSGVGVGAFNTGNFNRSWRAEPLSNGARVYNLAPYSGVIEYGRRTGKFPPKQPIARWAQRRLGLSEEDAQAAAFAIARAIAMRGLRGRHIVENALPALVVIVEREIMHELDLEMGKP